jgi:hypothetical protein
MISIIICSRTPDISPALRENIEETIGLEHELIIIDNSDKAYSIFTAYNDGIGRTNYDALCFIHEDILFHTQHWGNIVLDHLEDPSIGFIGVAGGVMLPRVPALWSFDRQVKHIRQSSQKHESSELQQAGTFNDKHFQPVVALDGVFLACRKELFNHIRFDEETFSGFHCYDQDICLQSHTIGRENRVINNLLLEHFSTGKLNREWVECQLKTWRKWKKWLPLSITEIKKEDLLKKEADYLKGSFTKKMIRWGYTNREIQDVYNEYHHLAAQQEPHPVSINRLQLVWKRLQIKPSSLFHKN